MGYVMFRGTSTASLSGVEVLEMPSHKKAAKRMTEYDVKGMDGTLHRDEGFENFDVTVRLILIDAPATARQLVNAWADGYGKLITSDDLSKAYKAIVKDEIEWHRDVASAFIDAFSSTKQYYIGNFCIYAGSIYKFTANHKGTWNANDVVIQPWLVKGVYDVADITFNCNPCMYEAVDSNIVFTQGGVITNPGTADAFPLIKVEGSGTCDFRIGETEEFYIIIYDMEANVPVYIDCETGYVYTASGSKDMVGKIPHLHLGDNTVVFGQNGLTKLTFTPRWRWV